MKRNKKLFHSHLWNKKVFHSHVWNKKVFHSPCMEQKSVPYLVMWRKLASKVFFNDLVRWSQSSSWLADWWLKGFSVLFISPLTLKDGQTRFMGPFHWTHIVSQAAVSTLLDATRRYPTLRDATRRYATLRDVRDLTLRDAMQLDRTQSDSTWHIKNRLWKIF
jgi:hypothetical protein